MEDAKKLINEAVRNEETLYIPKGKVDYRLPTGIPSLDRILGGGIADGRIVQIYGREGAGKSTLGLTIIAEAIKAGHGSVLVALENYDENHAKGIGIDVDSDLFSVYSGEFGATIFNLLVSLLRRSSSKVFVVDSIAAAPIVREDDAAKPDDRDKFQIGYRARMITSFLDRAQPAIRRKGLILVLINQLRTEIHTMGGSTMRPTGGKALQHATDIKINMTRERDKNIKGPKIKSIVNIDKGKDWDTIPFSQTILYIKHKYGIDKERNIIDECVNNGIVVKKGSWYYYEDLKWHGADAATEAILASKELYDDLYKKVLSSEPVDILTFEEGED